MSNLIFDIFFPLIMSLIMILPAVCFSRLPVNKKVFGLTLFINYFCIISLRLSMKNIICMVILFITSFIYLFFTYRNVIYPIVIFLIINIVISFSDHITGFMLTSFIKISLYGIAENKILYFTFGFITLLISCIISNILGVIFFNLKELHLVRKKAKDK